METTTTTIDSNFATDHRMQTTTPLSLPTTTRRPKRQETLTPQHVPIPVPPIRPPPPPPIVSERGWKKNHPEMMQVGYGEKAECCSSSSSSRCPCCCCCYCRRVSRCSDCDCDGSRRRRRRNQGRMQAPCSRRFSLRHVRLRPRFSSILTLRLLLLLLISLWIRIPVHVHASRDSVTATLLFLSPTSLQRKRRRQRTIIAFHHSPLLSSSSSYLNSYSSSSPSSLYSSLRRMHSLPSSLRLSSLPLDMDDEDDDDSSSSNLNRNLDSYSLDSVNVDWKAVLAALKLYKAAYGTKDPIPPVSFIVPPLAPWPPSGHGLPLGRIIHDIQRLQQLQPPRRTTMIANARRSPQQLRAQRQVLQELGLSTGGMMMVEEEEESPSPESSAGIQLADTVIKSQRNSSSTTSSTTSSSTTSSSSNNNSADPHDQHHHPSAVVHDARFHTVYRALQTYRTLYGDLLVPQPFVVPRNHDAWPRETWGLRLGTRVNAIRSQGAFVKNDPQRRALLDDLDFVWSTLRVQKQQQQQQQQRERNESESPSMETETGEYAQEEKEEEIDITKIEGDMATVEIEDEPAMTAAAAAAAATSTPLGSIGEDTEDKEQQQEQQEADRRMDSTSVASSSTQQQKMRLFEGLFDDSYGLGLFDKSFVFGGDGKGVAPDGGRNAAKNSSSILSSPKWGLVENGEGPSDFMLWQESLRQGISSTDSSSSNDRIDLAQDGTDSDEYIPPPSLAETLQEATERAIEVGVIEGLTPTKRVIKGKQQKDIPWFNDDFGEDFLFEDVVEALTVYKSIYGNYSNLTEDFIVPTPKQASGFLSNNDDDDDDNEEDGDFFGNSKMSKYDVDASARAAAAMASYENRNEGSRISNLRRLQDEASAVYSVATAVQVPVLDANDSSKSSVSAVPQWPVTLAGMQLGSIVSRIRDGSLEVKHLPERKQQLDALDFDWGNPDHFLDVAFEKAMCAFYAYYLIRGDMFVYEDFVMPDEDPWPQALAGYEIGKAVKRIRELQNFLEAYHLEKVSLLRMIDFVWFPTMALPLDPNETEMDTELLLLSAMGHPDYAKMTEIPMGLPEKIIADGPFIDSEDPKQWWRKWHNWEYVKDYWYGHGRRDNAFVLRQLGYPRMADEHEAKYGPGLFAQINETLESANSGVQDWTLDEKRELLQTLDFFRRELTDCTDIHPQNRDDMIADLDERMIAIMQDPNLRPNEEMQSEERSVETIDEPVNGAQFSQQRDPFNIIDRSNQAVEINGEDLEFSLKDELGLDLQ